mmetsp:Transcript_8909/g.39232  ORF Transcript_8909/g.39232 Transcript_8909/m.39232 type:complete len:318 (-) Transcript_8909:450-1403(-)
MRRARGLVTVVVTVLVRVRPVQHRQRPRAQQRARCRVHQLQRLMVAHVQRHLQQVHHHDRDDDLANLVLQVVDAADPEPRRLLQVALVELGPGQEELERSEAEHQAHHAEQEPVQRADSRGDQLHRIELHPRHDALEDDLLDPHGEQQRAQHERGAHAEQHEPARQEQRQSDEEVLGQVVRAVLGRDRRELVARAELPLSLHLLGKFLCEFLLVHAGSLGGRGEVHVRHHPLARLLRRCRIDRRRGWFGLPRGEFVGGRGRRRLLLERNRRLGLRRGRGGFRGDLFHLVQDVVHLHGAQRFRELLLELPHLLLDGGE